jgi:hypothetical protein
MTLIEQIATYLQNDLSLGTIATDIFIGFLPETPDTCIAVLDTGGVTPNVYVPTKSPTFQVLVRATNYDNGKTVLDSVRGLHRLFGQLVSGQDYFLKLHAISEGGHIGRDEQGRDLFSINFVNETRTA